MYFNTLFDQQSDTLSAILKSSVSLNILMHMTSAKTRHSERAD